MGLRIGVAGTGRLGRAHVRVLRSLAGVDHVGCFDVDAGRARAAAEEFGARAYPSLSAMLADVDAVSIVTSTSHHCTVALDAVAAGCDLFIEKPITATVAEGERVVAAAAAGSRILQVGHIERFNGALEAVLPRIGRPLFIEVHRLAPFTPRGTDVSVVMDLMIHDLDLLGLLVGGVPVDVRAKGAALLTAEPDIVNARLEYADGCVANVTASRVTASPMRKVRVFSTTGYYSIDLLGGSVTHYRKSDGFDARMAALQTGALDAPPALADFVAVEQFRSDGAEPLAKELGAFCRAVASRSTPPVTGEDGLQAMRLADAILNRVGSARM
ncbi:MAG TPA: Gfo/Idh/MocA family oxidoreductase [Candidatus Krumholzibacteria bacterium]|nr:Gfo/Idh/MocA family oxidoreductase [Candidatus Krumholzibacteria bacterium]